MNRRLPLGFIPLVDAAPLIIAAEFGFAEQEGLALDLHRAASWSMLRDMLDFGTVDAAQMLSVVPVARALGLGGGGPALETPMVLSLNGQAFCLSAALASRLRDNNAQYPFGQAAAAGRALARLGAPLRVGVPFPFSMHTELLLYWLDHAAPDLKVTIHTVPPPRMSEALAQDEIDAFCVGEPWGSHAIEVAGAELLLPGSAIWSQAPEKVLATRTGWCEAEPDLAGRLIRALWRAGRWTAEPQNRVTVAEVLSRPAHLDVPAELIERALSGHLMVSSHGQEAAVPQFLTFHSGVANFPWRSQAAWIGSHLAQRFGLDPGPAMAQARTTFRADLYRRHLAPIGSPMPRASEKAEGLLIHSEVVPAVSGTLILERNRFFDDQIFDPTAP